VLQNKTQLATLYEDGLLYGLVLHRPMVIFDCWQSGAAAPGKYQVNLSDAQCVSKLERLLMGQYCIMLWWRRCQSLQYCGKIHRRAAVGDEKATHALFHGGFWKNDHDFLIAFHSNLLSGVHGFRDNEVQLPTGYYVIVSTPPEALHALFLDEFWKSDHHFTSR